MARDSVTFRLEGEVDIPKLSEAFSRFADVLAELQRGRDAHVRWVLVDLNYGSAIATARAVPLDERSVGLVPTLVDDYLGAARSVASGEWDESRPVLRLVRTLTEVAGAENPVVLETSDDDVVFTAPAGAPDTSGPALRPTPSLGSVRGRVETLSQRGQLRFTLYELATDKAVSCYLEQGGEDLMRDQWGHVVDVTGTITRDGNTGRPRSIRRITQVDRVEEGQPDDYLRARGVLSSAEPAEVTIRRIRDAS